MPVLEEQGKLIESELALTIIEWLGHQVPNLVIKHADLMKVEVYEKLKASLQGEVGKLGIAKMGMQDGRLFVRLRDGTEESFGDLRGKDGESIIDANIDDDGFLCLTFAKNGEEETRSIGRVVGMNGRSIETTLIDDDGHLFLTFDDGSHIDLGNVKGRDGNRIERAEVVNGFLEITTAEPDGTTVRHRAGFVNGKDGLNGKDGEDGKDGVDGKPGRKGERGYAGRSIQEAAVNDHGHLILDYDDGQRHDCGMVRGNLARARINKNGDLKLILNTGMEINAGTVRASNGRDGLGFLWRGPYRDGETYFGQQDNPEGPYGDVVSYQGASYVATARTMATPPHGSWNLVAARAETSQMVYLGQPSISGYVGPIRPPVGGVAVSGYGDGVVADSTPAVSYGLSWSTRPIVLDMGVHRFLTLQCDDGWTEIPAFRFDPGKRGCIEIGGRSDLGYRPENKISITGWITNDGPVPAPGFLLTLGFYTLSSRRRWNEIFAFHDYVPIQEQIGVDPDGKFFHKLEWLLTSEQADNMQPGHPFLLRIGRKPDDGIAVNCFLLTDSIDIREVIHG